MSTWFYYNEQGEKIAVSGGQLKGLAKAGLITPETVVETEDGKSASAGKVKGLTFGSLAPPVETESYGLTAPPLEPSPFTASMPKTTDSLIASSLESTSPFTASIPETKDTSTAGSSVAGNPFIASIPATIDVPATDTSEVENPFTATMPTTERAVPQNVATSCVEEYKDVENESKNSLLGILLAIGFGFIAITLVIIAAISHPGGGGGSSGGGGGRGNQIEATVDRSFAIIQQSMDITGEFTNAMGKSPEAMRDASRKFSSVDTSSFPPGFQVTHRRLASAMIALADAVSEVGRAGNNEQRLSAMERRGRAMDNYMEAFEEFRLSIERRDWMR